MLVWFALFCVLVLVFILAFTRASIEAGEERFWFSYYLVIVPPVTAAAIVFALTNFGWPARLSVGLITLVVVAVVLLQIPRAADYIYENPARFRLILPAIATLEKAYLAISPTEPDRAARHETKIKRWREMHL